MKERVKSLFGTWLLVELVRGLMLTWRHMFARKITVQFPEEKTPMSPRFRGLHARLAQLEDGRQRKAHEQQHAQGETMRESHSDGDGSTALSR